VNSPGATAMATTRQSSSGSTSPCWCSTGLVIVEGVFRVPGVGGLLFGAIAARDRSLVVGIVAFVAILVIVANAVADVLVAALDPRLRAAAR